MLTQTNGRVIPQVIPGAGRDKVQFSIRTRDGHVTVVPDDVAVAISDGRLDPALFDATRLIAEGDGDDQRDDLPLIITGQPDLPTRLRAMASAGVTVDRTLSTLHASVARQGKAHPGAVLGLIAGAGPAPSLANRAAMGPRIWLDAQLKVSLAQNISQVGAPAAYARGITGAGVTIAVVDSGIDATHPDLAGKVIAAEDFVGDGNGTRDANGHGTHVASIAAGTGAASGGEFQGVAPDATLINARVCGALGQCAESAVLAGMEWAVATQHAPIVNMSLGSSFIIVGDDPLVDAVNLLSAQFGTLFVIAAGNSGPTPLSVASPGIADAALTVGAVDSSDELAFFSSVGPRFPDHAIKPDITAPGVAITAARAAGTALGPTVGDQYVTLSGTSMATPHVAGSAALVLQQHPDWSGEQLKAALMASAHPAADQTVYQQGAGRVDVDRATRQGASAEPPSVSFGIAAFPHDDDPPITRTVTYANLGADPITLSLTAALALDGVAAPDGMVTISPATLTVPAGSAADVAVTVDPRLGSNNGLYGGDLVATSGGDLRIVTPLGVERAAPTNNLHIVLIGADGQPTGASVTVDSVGADDAHAKHVVTGGVGQVTLTLPAGTYEISALGFETNAWLFAPRVAVSNDTAVTLDERTAKPIDLTIPGAQDLKFVTGSWSVTDSASGLSFLVQASSFNGELHTAEVGASAARGEIVAATNVVFATQGDRPSDFYFLCHDDDDHFPTGWRETIQPGEMATQTATYAGAEGTGFVEKVLPLLPDRDTAAQQFSFTGPVRRTEHFFAPVARWQNTLWPEKISSVVPGLLYLGSIEDGIRELVAGRHYVAAWNGAPFGPAFSGPSSFAAAPDGTNAPVRTGDTLSLHPGLFTSESSSPRYGIALQGRSRLTLLRDGAVIAQTTSFSAPIQSPVLRPESVQYRLEGQLTGLPAEFDLSRQISASWTFRSQHSDSVAVLPLPTLRFKPDLDEHNQTSARVLALPIRIERPVGAPTPRIAHADIEVSFDDGANWLPVPIVRIDDQALGVIIHPSGTQFVSLRGKVADVEGNQSDLTIIRAYGIAPP